MPTKEDILKKHTDKYRAIRTINKVVIEEIEMSGHDAMEEYAKQEAKEFNFFYIRTKNEYLGRTYDHIWNEYQKSKVI